MRYKLPNKIDVRNEMIGGIFILEKREVQISFIGNRKCLLIKYCN